MYVFELWLVEILKVWQIFNTYGYLKEVCCFGSDKREEYLTYFTLICLANYCYRKMGICNSTHLQISTMQT